MTNFFRLKKGLKRFIKSILPNFVFLYILNFYRIFFSKIPVWGVKIYQDIFFKERQFITIKNTTLKIMVDPKNGSTDKNLFFKKERDMDIINLVKKVCKTGDVFVDVGANIGYETIYASHIVGESGLVYSFEPLKNLASQIMESIQINKIKNITLINKALSDQAGKAFIYLNDEDAGLTSLETKDLANKKTEITLSTMDEELKNIKKRVSFIKVDVEGHELEVLKGAKSIIEKNNPYIVFEFNPHIYEKKLKGSSLELLTFLNNFGYQIKEIDYDKIISPENFMKFIKTILDDERMPNLVAVPK